MQLHWKTKAVAFRILDRIPFGRTAHFLLQRRLTKSWPRPRSDVEALLSAAKKSIEEFRQFSDIPLERSVFLEIGAGRDLVVPLALRVLGVGSVVSIDIERLAKLDLVNHAALSVSALTGFVIPVFKSWDELRRFGVDYRAPSSIEQLTDIHPNAFVSNEVLEHIPALTLRRIFAAAHDLMPSGSLAIHAIDYSDHFARGGAVSRYNFLRFSEGEWAPFNSGFQYVNRLRHSEYTKLIQEAGFSIVLDEPYSEEVPLEVLTNLADDFKIFSHEDLCIMRSRIIAKK